MTEKSKLIILCQVAGYMLIDIANAFSNKYENCVLLSGELRKRNHDLNRNVSRFNLIRYNPKNNFSRLLTWIAGTFQALLYIVFKGKNADLFITSNPPFGIFIPYLCKNNYSLLVYDIYPDILINYKIISPNSFIIKFWEHVNRKVFANAKAIFTISEGMKNQISKYINPDKIEVIPCWTDNSFLKPITKENNVFIKQQNVDGKFLVIYSGNVGYTHNVEILLDLAERIKRDNIVFLIIGEGDKKRILADRINKSGLKNIRLLPWQDMSIYPFSISSADLAIVTLSKEASIMSVPSKLFDIMSVGSPLLSIAEENSEISKIVNKYNMGINCSIGQLDEMLNFIYRLNDDKEFYQKLRVNSVNASKDYTPYNALKFVN
jgi:glycosyltransferase involved in cell wall biosynthesis